MSRLRRIAVRLLIGFLILGIILLASLIFTQTHLPRISLKPPPTIRLSLVLETVQ